jgi:hypothetical protein
MCVGQEEKPSDRGDGVTTPAHVEAAMQENGEMPELPQWQIRRHTAEGTLDLGGLVRLVVIPTVGAGYSLGVEDTLVFAESFEEAISDNSLRELAENHERAAKRIRLYLECRAGVAAEEWRS